MRTVVIAGIAVIVSVAALADAKAPLGELRSGSYSSLPRSEGLDALPADANCQPGSADPCPIFYAYRPDRKLTVWFSVRNDGPVPVTLDGVPHAWFAQFRPQTLVRPVATLDGGDPAHGTADLRAASFRPLVLASGAERTLGVEFRTTGDLAHACENWDPGTAMGWERVPVRWHWVLAQHEEDIPLLRPIRVMAPTSSDCGR